MDVESGSVWRSIEGNLVAVRRAWSGKVRFYRLPKHEPKEHTVNEGAFLKNFTREREVAATVWGLVEVGT